MIDSDWDGRRLVDVVNEARRPRSLMAVITAMSITFSLAVQDGVDMEVPSCNYWVTFLYFYGWELAGSKCWLNKSVYLSKWFSKRLSERQQLNKNKIAHMFLDIQFKKMLIKMRYLAKMWKRHAITSRNIFFFIYIKDQII